MPVLVVTTTGTGIFIGSDSCISINTRTETFTEADYDTITRGGTNKTKVHFLMVPR